MKDKTTTSGSLSKGFTLVELIVSLGLFTVVVLGATGAMLSMLDANRKAQAIRSAMDGLGFALDDIGRTVRVGWNYGCPSSASVFTSCLGGDTSIKIETDAGVIEYYFSGGKIKKSFTPPIGTGYSGLDLTPEGVTLSRVTFYVLGNQELLNDGLPPDPDQPRVIISLEGSAGTKAGLTSNFKIQTTVTARLPGATGG